MIYTVYLIVSYDAAPAILMLPQQMMKVKSTDILQVSLRNPMRQPASLEFYHRKASREFLRFFLGRR